MSSRREPLQPLDASPATFLTHHVVVPAAVIAMAASFLQTTAQTTGSIGVGSGRCASMASAASRQRSSR